MSTPRRLLAALAGVLLLAGCTGVPSSSSPQKVEELNLGAGPTGEVIKPTVNAPARQIVQEFLQANAVDPGKHTSARAFLTPAARNGWSDDRATIISDLSVGTYDPRTAEITVSGRAFGTLDKNGIFKPSLEGDGNGGGPVYYPFKLSTVDGQYRISQVRPGGLLLTDKQFTENYEQHSLYFYDDADQYLVQDPRWSDIDDRTQLCEWLLNQLAGGPREELQNAVTSDTLPAQADPTRMTVDVGAPTKVEIPGSSQLDADGRNRLAAQLSETLDLPLSGNPITITDSGRPISIRATGGTVFGPQDFTSALGPPTPSTDVYYLVNGRVMAETGKPLAGPLGRPGPYFLTTVALSRPDPAGPLLAAGVAGSGSQAQLVVGNQQSGLKPTGVRGVSTRPAFARGRREVWIGSGTKIIRVRLSGAGGKTAVDQVTLVNAPEGARIRALRPSPDGTRIAVVFAGPAGGQLFIGSIVRGTGQVRIDALEQISPQLATITDVAWLNPLRLFAIGRLTTSSDSLTFDTGVDGTDWSSQVVGLSRRPDYVTVTGGASAWVSADGFVWQQSAGQWVSPSGGQTAGTAPIYVE